MERRHTVLGWGGAVLAVVGFVACGVIMLSPSGAAQPGAQPAERATQACSGVCPSTTPECTNANLTAKYKGGDAAMSHVYGRIILRNTSDESCWIRGYGGLSYVGGGTGKQVGAAADRTASNRPKVVLAPGDKVRSAVVETSTAPYPKKECKPTRVDGFRVYIPDETRAQFIEHETTGCANDAIHLLSHKAYH